jgi:hypothetical protein
MRMKTIQAVRLAIKTVDRLLNTNLPMMTILLSSSAASTHRETR